MRPEARARAASGEPSLEVVPCPECERPAEVVERCFLIGTDGPVEHVRIQCVDRHWFLMPAPETARTPRAA
ncbi:hypothetical protein [Nocardioides humi]|uniref:Uncharacterized protein n=1 Tax=Nocardioides humi TaxID=449461 RepID=A0ABN2BR81_9ACTN|nr:hypothetical protein [Nocardioides humi]